MMLGARGTAGTPHPTRVRRPGRATGEHPGERPGGAEQTKDTDADAGVVGVEFAIVAGMVFAVLFAVVQIGVWAHTRTLVQAAAMEAVTAASGAADAAGSVTGDPTGAGEAAAGELIGQRGTIEEVSVARGEEWVTATVTVTDVSFLVPGLRVSGHATAAVERYVAP